MTEGPDWRLIPGFDGVYEISVAGEVRRLRPPFLLGSDRITPYDNGNGYIYVKLHRRGKRGNYRRSRLVLAAFRGSQPRGFQANHINGVKTDDRLENLEWISQTGNLKHAYATGLRQHLVTNAKLTPMTAQEIRSQSDRPVAVLAREYGIARSTVRDIRYGRTWKNPPDEP